MFKVVKYFTDLQDNSYPYHVGDTFPREGFEVSEDRLKELSSVNNKRGVVLIEEVVEEDIPKDAPSEPEEAPLEEETGETSPKKSKAKKSTKKA